MLGEIIIIMKLVYLKTEVVMHIRRVRLLGSSCEVS